MASSNQWTTKAEMRFIDRLNKGSLRVFRLKNYLKAAKMRRYWQNMDSKKVMKYTRAKLWRAGNAERARETRQSRAADHACDV